MAGIPDSVAADSNSSGDTDYIFGTISSTSVSTTTSEITTETAKIVSEVEIQMLPSQPLQLQQQHYQPKQKMSIEYLLGNSAK